MTELLYDFIVASAAAGMAAAATRMRERLASGLAQS
jgi:hypothetical protein